MEKEMHIYAFEAKEFYVSIKAVSLKKAIEKFSIMFGEYLLNDVVYTIHLCTNS